MKILGVLFIIFVSSLASKEYVDEISQLLDNPELILELVKRLGSDKPLTTQEHSSVPENHSKTGHHPYVPVIHGNSRSCKTLQFKKTIIRTDDSRKAGAVFLSFTDNVASNADCLSMCCSKRGCDLAVYENKTKHNCYLFRCQDTVTGENKCLFDSHADYISTTLTTASGVGDIPTDNPDTSRENNRKDSHETSGMVVTEHPKPVPPQPKPTPSPTQLPHSVALGNWCQLDLSCEDPHAVCSKDACQCGQHFEAKNGICREICGKERVACERRGTARIGPDCIHKSQVCDGTTQCADGSDEKECKRYPVASPPSNTPVQQDRWNETPSTGKDADSSSSEEGLHAVSGDNSPKSKIGSTKSTDHKHVEETKVKTDETSKVDSQEVNKKPDDSQLTNGELESSNTVADSSEHPVQSPASHIVKTTTTTSTAPPAKVEVVDQEEEVFVTKEKVIVTSPTDGAQGPIVALSLGLAITLMLLIFVGCRLRNVRHRLRKGRPLHSNEADYLINGMYL